MNVPFDFYAYPWPSVLLGTDRPRTVASGLSEVLAECADVKVLASAPRDDLWEIDEDGATRRGWRWTRAAMRRVCFGSIKSVRRIDYLYRNGDGRGAAEIFNRAASAARGALRDYRFVLHPPTKSVIGVIAPDACWLGPERALELMEDAERRRRTTAATGEEWDGLALVERDDSVLQGVFAESARYWTGPDGRPRRTAVETTFFWATGAVSCRPVLVGPHGEHSAYADGGHVRGARVSESSFAESWPSITAVDERYWRDAMAVAASWRWARSPAGMTHAAQVRVYGATIDALGGVLRPGSLLARRVAASVLARARGDVTAFDLYLSLATSSEYGGFGRWEGARDGAVALLRLSPVAGKKTGVAREPDEKRSEGVARPTG